MKSVLIYCLAYDEQWRDLHAWLDREYPERETHGICMKERASEYRDRVSFMYEYPGRMFTVFGLLYHHGLTFNIQKYDLVLLPVTNPDGWEYKRLKLASVLLVKAKKFAVFFGPDKVVPFNFDTIIREVNLRDFKILYVVPFLLVAVAALGWGYAPIYARRVLGLFRWRGKAAKNEKAG